MPSTMYAGIAAPAPGTMVAPIRLTPTATAVAPSADAIAKHQGTMRHRRPRNNTVATSRSCGDAAKNT